MLERKRTPTFYHLSFVLFDEGLACECNSTTRCIKTVALLISQAGRVSRTRVFSVEIFMVVLFFRYFSAIFPKRFYFMGVVLFLPLPTFLSVIFAWSERVSGAIGWALFTKPACRAKSALLVVYLPRYELSKYLVV